MYKVVLCKQFTQDKNLFKHTKLRILLETIIAMNTLNVLV
jgi:hypothetical protein